MHTSDGMFESRVICTWVYHMPHRQLSNVAQSLERGCIDNVDLGSRQFDEAVNRIADFEYGVVNVPTILRHVISLA